MGEAIKAVLYGLLNIYNDGENAGQGCGCLTVAALIIFAFVVSSVANSDLPDGFKIFFFSVLLAICLFALGWMIYQTIKQWWNEHHNDNNENNDIHEKV